MSGETDLTLLLKNMKPALQPQTYVFATIPEPASLDLAALQPLATFRESEGLTLIVEEERAIAAGLIRSGAMRQITLTVHSSLEAVGLTAAISAALTASGISANVVAAFHHDHVFVGAGDAERALRVLEALT